MRSTGQVSGRWPREAAGITQALWAVLIVLILASIAVFAYTLLMLVVFTEFIEAILRLLSYN